MTGGGLMQLVAYGAQDVYLTGNPQITFFKVVYRRHTNFAMESIENPFNGAPNFGKKVTCTIQRNGDLIYRMYLQATLPQVQLQSTDGSGAQFRWLNWMNLKLVVSVLTSIMANGYISGMNLLKSQVNRPVMPRWLVMFLNLLIFSTRVVLPVIMIVMVVNP